MTRVTEVAFTKNEGRFLLEWIAYHRLIGVRDFLIYTNDCEDGLPGLPHSQPFNNGQRESGHA